MTQKPYYYKDEGIDVYSRDGDKHITAEDAAEIPDFWSQVDPYTAPPPEAPAGASAEDILGSDAYGDELAGAEAGYYETLTPEYGTELREQSDADIMKKYQQEIDALEVERVAARGRITSQYGQIGKERAGTSTAIQARRGLVGSTFGTQHKSELASQTQREQDAAMAYSNAQYAERKRSIMGQVRTAQADEAKIRLEAAQLGSQAKIEEIRGRKTRQDERVSTAIKNLLGMEADVEDEELMNEIAGELGISVKDLMSKYSNAKSEAEEAQIDIELKRDKTKAEIAKMDKDREMIDKKFEQDRLEFGYDQANKDRDFALDKWKAENQASKGYAPSSSKKLYNELGGYDVLGVSFNDWYEQKSGGIVEWSEENEKAGIVGESQAKIDEITNNPTAPNWFNEQAPELYGMSKDSWQTEWDEMRNPILDAFRKKESSGFSGQQKIDLEDRYGPDWEETVPRSQQIDYINSLKKSSGRTY